MEIFSHWKDGKKLDDDATISTTRPKKIPHILEKNSHVFWKISHVFWRKVPSVFTFYQSLSKGDECSHINSRDNPIPIA